MVPGQPGDAAVGVDDLEPDAVRAEIVEQRVVGDRDAVREARRAARILQIGDVVRPWPSEGRPGAGSIVVEALPVARVDAGIGGGLAAEFGELGGKRNSAGSQLFSWTVELIDIGFAPAEAGRQRQRHRPGAGIDRAEEAGGEFGAGLGDQRDAVARLDAERDEAAGVGQRVLAQLGSRYRPAVSVPRASWKLSPRRPCAA